MLNSFSLRFLTLAIFWIGLLVLKLINMLESHFLPLAVVFSVLILLGTALEIFLGYAGDRYLLSVAETLLAIGLVLLIRINPSLAEDQFIWANLGLVVFYIVLFGLRDYRKLEQYQYIWGLAALVLLLITLLFGVNIHGATSWIKIGSRSFQPEELVKVVLLLFMSAYLNNNQELLRVGTIQVGRISLPDRKTLGPFAFICLIVLALLAAQKSLGTALVFFLLMVFIVYMVTERLFYLVTSVPLVVLMGTAGYILFDHVKIRVATWLNPWLDSTGGGFQIAQSIFAISGGRLLGTGLGNGIGAYQIPLAESDFIFSVMAEELGFFGAMAVITLFLVLVLRALAIGIKASDRFGQILASGIGILIGLEVLIILAGVTKMLPLTGLPLPWVSYGGSSLIIHFLLLGLVTNISHNSAFSMSGVRVGKRVGIYE
ncbi:MAG: FtsW/RodA/SpoVE family cell cycle protein [Peptococcaceae bacterium]|nr:FtsW/RodA/SpoVE family cell cycle protein [Peptococcaceae bacterium]